MLYTIKLLVARRIIKKDKLGRKMRKTKNGVEIGEVKFCKCIGNSHYVFCR